MAYFLDFDERALKEWRKLGSTVREQLKKKLVEVLESPRIEGKRRLSTVWQILKFLRG